MTRLDDDKLNLSPEISRALGYQSADQSRPRRTPPTHHPVATHARREESFGLPTFISIIAIVCVVCLVAADTAHHQATTQPSQPQVSHQAVPVVGKQQQHPDGIPGGTAESAPDVRDPAAQVPAQSEIQYAVDVREQGTAENPNTEVNQANEMPRYLPANYDTGRVTAPLFLVREMPHGGAVDPLGYVPAGTCLLYERANANGWRRVASFDGRYLGYAQVYPTVAYQPRPMRPELLEAIEMIRRIP